MLNCAAPFFIVDDLGATLAFYQSKLGFDVLYKGDGDDFFAIMGRDKVMVMFKAIAPEVHPQPIVRVTNGLGGTPTSTRMIPTHCTRSLSAGGFPCTGNWPIRAMDSGPSRLPITADMCGVLGGPSRSSYHLGIRVTHQTATEVSVRYP